jgi:carboxylesterase type B
VPAEPVSTPLPVMLFIHGGGFNEGASSQAVFMGTRLAAKGQAMIVTINYRLGVLGSLGGGTGIDQISPNLGLGDQQLAMSWVHDNAAAFGGNPARITLFGESAGAMSIGAHLSSASSAPLFHSAIMESNPYGIPFKNAEQGNELRDLFDSTPIVQGCPATTPRGASPA